MSDDNAREEFVNWCEREDYDPDNGTLYVLWKEFESQRQTIEQLQSQLASEKSKSASCLAEFLSSKSRSDQAYIDGIVDAWNHIYCVVEDKDAEIDRKRLALVDMIKVDNEQMKQIQSLTERNKQLEDSIKQWIGNPTTGNEWTMRDLINTPTNNAGG